jgi:hypothetical protein
MMTASAITSKKKSISGLFAAALTSGVFITSALGAAPDAHATCASFFGLGNGNGCTSSTTSIAIAIGDGATATAEGLFGTAFATGTNSFAAVYAGSFLDSAMSLGTGATTVVYGVAGMATALGNFSQAGAGTNMFGPTPGFPTQIGNVAINLSNNPASGYSLTAAVGTGNLAVNLGGDTNTFTEAFGSLSSSMTFFGTTNSAYAENSSNLAAGFANFAFAALGSHNTVHAGGGPFAVAGALFQSSTNVVQHGPGLNINGFRVGTAAAPKSAASQNKTASALAVTKTAKAAATNRPQKAHAATTKHASTK